ncbi:unnamed protein product [Acanthoscelides obtectus]|uniref:Uncharacterized protein n=1 Tax=Acanthoscelides obtectus TaxID=200917 RepID=A0A9P0P1Z5_ACAOB|nr:unnamed protein product [Acanthoscelides obtectus]CAK1623775.1 hypothetical protein AOBTE_LOCUS2173 [Acanthoscelides obtectus]
MSVYVKSEDRIVFDESGDEKNEIIASISSGLLDLKMATCRLMTNLALDVHKLPESTKMLKKFESLCYLEVLSRLRKNAFVARSRTATNADECRASTTDSSH